MGNEILYRPPAAGKPSPAEDACTPARLTITEKSVRVILLIASFIGDSWIAYANVFFKFSKSLHSLRALRLGFYRRIR